MGISGNKRSAQCLHSRWNTGLKLMAYAVSQHKLRCHNSCGKPMTEAESSCAIRKSKAKKNCAPAVKTSKCAVSYMAKNSNFDTMHPFVIKRVHFSVFRAIVLELCFSFPLTTLKSNRYKKLKRDTLAYIVKSNFYVATSSSIRLYSSLCSKFSFICYYLNFDTTKK